MEQQQLSLLDDGRRMIVAASPLVVAGLRSLGCEIVASTGFAVQLPQLAMRLRPDAVLLHADGRRREDVLAPTRRLRAMDSELRLLVMLPATVAAAWAEPLETLGCEVLAHDCDADTLRTLVGSTELAPSIALSERELEVLRGVAAGLTNRAIASRLALSEYTVKNHLKRIHEKFGVHSRTQAVTAASNAGHAVLPALTA